MGKGGGSDTEQNQTVNQSTTVTVQNVIDTSRPLEPLEKVKMLVDVFATLDAAEAKKENPAGASVNVTNIPAAAYLSNPLTLGMIVGGVLLSVYLLKRRR